MEDAPEGPDSDAILVARFRDGDEAAFDTLVGRHRGAIYRLAHRLGGGHAEADDLTQEAFLRAYRALPRFRGAASFRTWITRIAINVAINARHAREPALPLDEAGAIAAGPAGPDVLLRRQVRKAVADLPRRQREVLVLKTYAGLTFREIATAATTSVGTAKATFFQAVRNLRVRLAGATPSGAGEAPLTAPGSPPAIGRGRGGVG